MNKEEWIERERNLKAAFNEAQIVFDNEPCTKTATILSNAREALKAHNKEGYKGRDTELRRKLASDIAQILDYANGRADKLPNIF